MDGVMDGSCFVILNDGPDSYIRVTDVLEILSPRFSPKDRDQIAEFLTGVLSDSHCPDRKLN
jgi:hypothetical protein